MGGRTLVGARQGHSVATGCMCFGKCCGKTKGQVFYALYLLARNKGYFLPHLASTGTQPVLSSNIPRISQASFPGLRSVRPSLNTSPTPDSQLLPLEHGGLARGAAQLASPSRLLFRSLPRSPHAGVEGAGGD